MVQDLQLQKNHMLKNECSTNQRSLSVTRHLPGSESRITQGLHPPANQLFVNGPNITQNSNSLQQQLSSNKTRVIKACHPPTDLMLMNKSNGKTYLQHQQLSSESVQMIQNFHSVTYQLSSNESNISQQSCYLSDQLPLNSMSLSRNSNMFNQQLPTSASLVGYPPAHVSSLSEFLRNQEEYPSDHQQSEREFIMRQCVERHSKDSLSMLQNQYIPNQQTVGIHGSYPLSTNLLKMRFNLNQEPSISDASLHQNLYSQYSEKVHICVMGPPRCGKADLIRTFAKNDIRILTEKPLGLVLQQGMISFGTTLKIDVWYADDLTSAADDLRSLCRSSKSAIVLVYSVAQKSTLLTVLEWIKILKSDIALNVPIMLIGNTTTVNFSCSSKDSSDIATNFAQFSDDVRAKEEYDFAAFDEFSAKSVEDVEGIFLIAAFKAFSRTKQTSVRVW
ncbi:unnamed protein product [Larinioides sclopetarius]|uniref:Uncharacterized protein n=1 Tax=Larinioides sclopetarius TaxID=280406 RepID=A0AAV2BIL2_9ARAC